MATSNKFLLNLTNNDRDIGKLKADMVPIKSLYSLSGYKHLEHTWATFLSHGPNFALYHRSRAINGRDVHVFI